MVRTFVENTYLICGIEFYCQRVAAPRGTRPVIVSQTPLEPALHMTLLTRLDNPGGAPYVVSINNGTNTGMQLLSALTHRI